MRKITVFLCMATAMFFISCDQENTDDIEPIEPVAEEIIYIADENFKHALVSTNSIDTTGDGEGDSDIDLNNDGEIQRSEANAIEGLIINFYDLEINSFLDLTGIENFVNLNYLKMTGDRDFSGEENSESNLITYDFSALEKLEFLEINNLFTNYMEALNLSGLSNLKEIRLMSNRPYFYEGANDNYSLPINFMDVNMEGLISLTTLNIHNSYLFIDYCQVPSLKYLDTSYLEGGEPEVFDFHCLTELEYLDISDNHIVSLILKNGSLLNTLVARDIGYGEDGFANYYYLEYICIDDIPEEYDQIASLRDDDTVVVTDCEF